jgi:serine/threonine-protein kinase RsbW
MEPSGDCGQWDIERVVDASLDDVRSMCVAMEDYCRDLQATTPVAADKGDDRFCGDVALALSEILTNVVEHGYRFETGKTIHLRMRKRRDELEMLLVDDAPELPGHLLKPATVDFDPLDLHDLPEGGFGWSIIHDIMDGVHYERRNGKNHLLLNKKIT